MLLFLSHMLAFVVLSVSSWFDIFNDHDVPDLPGLVGIAGGLILYSLYAFQVSSWEPLLWCLGVGAVFSAYGWAAYWKGMWGGADAMMLSALGFMVPGPVSGAFSISYVLDLLTNFMLAALAVTILYSVYKFTDQSGSLEKVLEALKEDEKLLSAIIILGGFTGLILNFQSANGLIFFAVVLIFAFIYEFLRLVEDEYMVAVKAAEDVEEGDVPAPDQGFGRKIRGLDEEEVEEVEEELEVRTGVPFIPVFLVALLLTDLTASGIWLLYAFY